MTIHSIIADQCLFCEMSAICFQMVLLLIEYFCPVMVMTMTDPILESMELRPESDRTAPIDVSEMPIHLQLFHSLLRRLEEHKDADVLYHILQSLKLMALHAEIVHKSVRTHVQFISWILPHIFIPNLWLLLQSEFSQISEICTKLMSHCIRLPEGKDMFWKLVEDNFESKDYRVRFRAVERMTTIAHFLDSVQVLITGKLY